VREVKKKVLGIAVVLMAVAMLATPMVSTAQACGCRGYWGQATEKIPVKFGGPFTPFPPEFKKWGDFQIGRGGILSYSNFAIWDTRDGTFIIGPGITSLWTANYVVNLETGKGVLCYDVVITIPSKGTFEGYVIEFGTFSIAGPYVGLQDGFRYGVIRGTGDYEGWKLVVSAETTGGVSTFENYLYKPAI
jgi:hypothetical protein